MLEILATTSTFQKKLFSIIIITIIQAAAVTVTMTVAMATTTTTTVVRFLQHPFPGGCNFIGADPL